MVRKLNPRTPNNTDNINGLVITNSPRLGEKKKIYAPLSSTSAETLLRNTDLALSTGTFQSPSNFEVKNFKVLWWNCIILYQLRFHTLVHLKQSIAITVSISAKKFYTNGKNDVILSLFNLRLSCFLIVHLLAIVISGF